MEKWGVSPAFIVSLFGADFTIDDYCQGLELIHRFGLEADVCINKWDLNPAMADAIARTTASNGARVAGRVRYDDTVTKAQVDARTVVECECEAADDIRNLWFNLESNA